jgi:Protein of unknown function (DUF3306)
VTRAKDEDFLGRWSARKLKARPAPRPEPEEAEAPAVGPSGEGAPEKTEAEILDELGLPDPDSLAKGDDFTAFLRAGIPARLRERALRSLWVSDLVLANLDGLNDYDQDFTDRTTVRPEIGTAYRVGRGLVREAPQVGAAQAADAPAPSADTPAEKVAAEPGSGGALLAHEPAAGASAEAEVAPDVRPDGAAHADAPAESQARPTCRPPRMRFRFG